MLARYQEPGTRAVCPDSAYHREPHTSIGCGTVFLAPSGIGGNDGYLDFTCEGRLDEAAKARVRAISRVAPLSQRDGIRGWLRTPALGASSFTSLMMLVFVGFVLSLFFLARNRRGSDLALVTAAVCSAASLIKINATGTYVAWGLPFYLIGLFTQSDRRFDTD